MLFSNNHTIPFFLSGPIRLMFKKPELDVDDFVCNNYFSSDQYDVVNAVLANLKLLA